MISVFSAEELNKWPDSWWPYITTIFVSLVSAIRLYVGGAPCTSQNRIDGKIVLITGASGGIGLEIAHELASRGAFLILAVRNAEKGKHALEKIIKRCPDAKVVLKIMDVSEFASIRDVSKQILGEFDYIDVLINNAGVIQPFKLTSDGNELTMATNYLGPFLFTHLLLPLLNESKNGRVLNVASDLIPKLKIDMDSLPFGNFVKENEAFEQSKLAVAMFTKQMSNLYKRSKITFNSVSPGLVRNTNFWNNSKTKRPIVLRNLFWPWRWLTMKTPQEGAQSVVYLATEPTLGSITGQFFSNCQVKDTPNVLSDTKLCATLYEKTCSVVNVNGKDIRKNVLKSGFLDSHVIM